MTPSAQLTITGTAHLNGWDCKVKDSAQNIELHTRGGYSIEVCYRENGGIAWANYLTPASPFPRNIVGPGRIGRIVAFLSESK